MACQNSNSNSLKRPRPGWQWPLLLKKRVKRNVPVEVDEESDNQLIGRRWEDMNHDILVSIMKRLDVVVLVMSTCLVCKSWLSATLDALFPPSHVFSTGDYCLLSDSYRPRMRNRFWSMIQLHLNRKLPTQHSYTKLELNRHALSTSANYYIAQRLPSITSLKFTIKKRERNWFWRFSSCWQGLVEVDGSVQNIYAITMFWPRIQKLRLHGEIMERQAIMIANNFPCLTHLTLRHCSLPGNALSVILEGQKNLTYLDIAHARLDKYKNGDLLSKASKIPQFLRWRCEYEHCSVCFRFLQYHAINIA